MIPIKIICDKPLNTLSTFGIGGIASGVIEVSKIDEMQRAIDHCRCIHKCYLILGKGSNCLFSDSGYAGIAILNKIKFFEEKGAGIFRVGAGYSFSLLGTQTARWGWGGLEFASGIPGSVGGAIFMNAGANGQETSTCLESIEIVDECGCFHLLKKEDIQFAYRYSSFQAMPGVAIVAATFRLPPSSKARTVQQKILAYRKETQPYKAKSAGCVFKNPPLQSVGALLEKHHLKGLSVGDAEVSTLHGNFIINRGHATAEDVIKLIALIQREIKAKENIDLESEIRIIPYSLEDT